LRIFDFDVQFVEYLILEGDDDGIFAARYVPKIPFAFFSKNAGGDQKRK
jgi:hypothetical protein